VPYMQEKQGLDKADDVIQGAKALISASPVARLKPCPSSGACSKPVSRVSDIPPGPTAGPTARRGAAGQAESCFQILPGTHVLAKGALAPVALSMM
jgi:hypothetical protein